MKKLRVMVTVLAAVLLVTGSVYAEGKNLPKRGEGEKGNIYKELQLTPEQENKLEVNRKAQRQEIQKLHEDYKASLKKLQAKLKDPAVTRASVEPLVNEIKELKAKQIDVMINGIFAVKSILTPEQYAKFNELMEKKIKDRKDSTGKFGKAPKVPPAKTE